MKPSAEYKKRIYAGVLGKMIGVHLGRPVEGWDFDPDLSPRQIGESWRVPETDGLPVLRFGLEFSATDSVHPFPSGGAGFMVDKGSIFIDGFSFKREEN